MTLIPTMRGLHIKLALVVTLLFTAALSPVFVGDLELLPSPWVVALFFVVAQVSVAALVVAFGPSMIERAEREVALYKAHVARFKRDERRERVLSELLQVDRRILTVLFRLYDKGQRSWTAEWLIGKAPGNLYDISAALFRMVDLGLLAEYVTVRCEDGHEMWQGHYRPSGGDLEAVGCFECDVPEDFGEVSTWVHYGLADEEGLG